MLIYAGRGCKRVFKIHLLVYFILYETRDRIAKLSSSRNVLDRMLNAHSTNLKNRLLRASVNELKKGLFPELKMSYLQHTVNKVRLITTRRRSFRLCCHELKRCPNSALEIGRRFHLHNIHKIFYQAQKEGLAK